MNAIAMILPQVVAPNTGTGRSGVRGTANDFSPFKNVLTSEQAAGKGVPDQANLDLKELLTNLVAGDISHEDLGLDEESLEMMNESIDLSTIPNEYLLDLEKVLGKFNQLSEEDSFNNDSILTSLDFQHLNDVPVAVNPVNSLLVKEQFETLFADVRTLLSQINSEQDLAKAAPKILELLQQWSALEKKDGNLNSLSTLFSGANNEGSKELLIWKDLVQVFHRREQLALKQVYNSDAKVTTQDVAKWLGKALANQTQTERIGIQGMDFAPATSLSRLEQYTIHINQSQGSQSAGQQMVEQFQDVVKTSKFLAMPNGTNQLSITLNPNNLGEMIVRLTQIDGEMTVKIMVTTQIAKEMLETNINQLRNMFSPNQVVIEKQDLNTNQTSEQMKEQKDQQMDSRDGGQQNHREQEEQRQTEIDFATQFQELLMNEKV